MQPPKYTIKWSDLDPNWHVANSNYSRIFTDARIFYFEACGITQEAMEEVHTGPAIIHEHIYYIKEVKLGQEVTIDLMCSGSSECGKYGRLIQHMYGPDGQICCYLEMTYVWLDTMKRRSIVPSEKLSKGINAMIKSENFEILNKSCMKVSGIPYNKSIDND